MKQDVTSKDQQALNRVVDALASIDPDQPVVGVVTIWQTADGRTRVAAWAHEYAHPSPERGRKTVQASLIDMAADGVKHMREDSLD